MRRYSRGISYIEMMFVCFLIMLICSIAVRSYEAIRKKAIVAEAVTALGAIKTAEESYYNFNNAYAATKEMLADTGYLNLNDLNGPYFTTNCYFIILRDPRFAIACKPSTSSAPKKNMVAGWEGWIMIDDKGNVYTSIRGVAYPSPPSWMGSVE